MAQRLRYDLLLQRYLTQLFIPSHTAAELLVKDLLRLFINQWFWHVGPRHLRLAELILVEDGVGKLAF